MMIPRSPVSGRIAGIALLLGLGLGLPGALCADEPEAAEEGAPAADALTPFFEAVKAPATDEAVRALMKRPELQEAEHALRAVGRLWHGGGPHAAVALRTLAGHADPAVKEAALRGVYAVGLRGEAGTRGERELRRSLTHPEIAVRRAAYEAVGQVGSGDDVASLVLGLVSEEPGVRSLASRALAMLTGERHGADAIRWAFWWERSRNDLEMKLEEALETLDSGELDELVEAQAWNIVERRAWLLPAQVEQKARAWLGSMDEAQRLRGYRLVPCVRAASLADDVLKASRQDVRGPVLEQVTLAKRSLGLLPPGV
jgi:HEAT repeat protein